MTGEYLSLLYGLLTSGVSSLSPAFRQAHADYALSTLKPDGGFRGRRGGSDLYYTDFAIRVLHFCATGQPDLSLTAQFIERQLACPDNVVDAFNALNSARLLDGFGYHICIDPGPIKACLAAQQLASGGFCRPKGFEISAYNTFLARLCFDMLQEPFPDIDLAVESLRALKRRDGGFSEMPSDAFAQTSATAAVLTFLLIAGRLTDSDISHARQFLVSLQTPDGGLLPCEGAVESDLLSTFTGLSTMFLTDSLGSFDLPAAARMVKLSMHLAGGFCACPSETEPDIEYTFYGLGVLALLRLYREANG